MELWRFFLMNSAEVLSLTLEHLFMVSLAMTLACALGIPAGILMTRVPRLENVILGFANMVQTIPSLALFGFLISVPLIGGLGVKTAIVALVLYALASHHPQHVHGHPGKWIRRSRRRDGGWA